MRIGSLVLAVAIVLGTSACAAGDDGDTQSDDTSATGSESTGAEPMTCIDARADAAAFVQANAACDVDEDCTSVDGFCVIEGATCGALPIRVAHDPAAWAEIEAGLDTCTHCGADPCGACSVCTNGACGLTVDCG